MKVEIREQRPGDPWPSGHMWETPTAANLRQICADLTDEEVGQLVQTEPGRPALRLAHAVAARIAEVVKKRGDDVLIVKRSVVKLRRLADEDGLPSFKGDVHERDMATIRWVAPVLSDADASAILAQLAGQPRSVAATLAAIKTYLQTTGPVEFVMVDDPGEPVS